MNNFDWVVLQLSVHLHNLNENHRICQLAKEESVYILTVTITMYSSLLYSCLHESLTEWNTALPAWISTHSHSFFFWDFQRAKQDTSIMMGIILLCCQSHRKGTEDWGWGQVTLRMGLVLAAHTPQSRDGPSILTFTNMMITKELMLSTLTVILK